MIAEPWLIVLDAPGEADREAILAGLIEFNLEHVVPGAMGPLNDPDGNTIDGPVCCFPPRNNPCLNLTPAGCWGSQE